MGEDATIRLVFRLDARDRGIGLEERKPDWRIRTYGTHGYLGMFRSKAQFDYSN
jgi:hypothetical protein